MNTKNKLSAFLDGFDLVLERLIEFKIYKKTTLVISDGNGGIVKIPANELRDWYEKQKTSINNSKS